MKALWVVVPAAALILTACGGSSEHGAGMTPRGLCSRVDAATVNDIFGVEPPFEARKAHGRLPLPGAVTCEFYDGAARTVTVSGVENAPEQYDSFLANANNGTAGVLKPIKGIGDKAAGAIARGISAEVVFQSGDEFVVVVCVDADQYDKDRALFDKCKQLAAHLAQ